MNAAFTKNFRSSENYFSKGACGKMYGPLGVSRNFNILVTRDFFPIPIKFRLDIILLKKKKKIIFVTNESPTIRKLCINK